MGVRTQIGKGLEATLGRERTAQIRTGERQVRQQLADLLAPPAAPKSGAKPGAKSGATPGLRQRKTASNPLADYFRDNDGRLIDKWHHYFDIYHHHFARFRNRPVTILEFGVYHGGSLQMWKDYFGPQARIFGVDINPDCARLAEPQIEILIGDQEDRSFLRKVAETVGPVDVLIEDGGHTMGQQLATFEELWPSITNRGVYLVEDLHTSYWENFGGGHRREGTFIEFAKTLIDQQHAWHSREPEKLEVDDYTTSIAGMHVYDSVIVFDKDQRRRPTKEKRGTPSF